MLVALLVGGLGVGAWLAPAPPEGGSLPAALPRAGLAPSIRLGAPASLVANVNGRVAVVYRRPGATRRWRSLANPTADGTPLVFLVRARRAGWVEVRLPVRPNGSTGWIREDSVRLAENDFRVRVVLRSHRLTVWRGGRVVQRERVGVGRAATPTPAGTYYVTELLRQPDPRGPYGPYALGISAYSPVLTSFGGGRGEVGIHGTNAPRGIGHDISHGCIRLRNAAIARLARMLPLGTPVTIVV
jgi:lipoprotein-anchoring transpeptidase ErfK/SrfK